MYPEEIEIKLCIFFVVVVVLAFSARDFCIIPSQQSSVRNRQSVTVVHLEEKHWNLWRNRDIVATLGAFCRNSLPDFLLLTLPLGT